MICNILGSETLPQRIAAIFDTIRKESGMKTAREFRTAASSLATEAEVDSLALNTYSVTMQVDLTPVREAAYLQIDNFAAVLDKKYTTTGGQMAAIYAGKLKQCEKWRANGEPADVSSGPYGYIRAEILRLGILGQPNTAADAVAAMETVGAQWEDTLAEKREEFRGVGKAKVAVATDVAAITAAVAEAKASIEAL